MPEILLASFAALVVLVAWRHVCGLKLDLKAANDENRALQKRVGQMVMANLSANARAFRAEIRLAALRRQSVVPSVLDSWMHVEAETDEAAADLLAAKLGGKS